MVQCHLCIYDQYILTLTLYKALSLILVVAAVCQNINKVIYIQLMIGKSRETGIGLLCALPSYIFSCIFGVESSCN